MRHLGRACMGLLAVLVIGCGGSGGSGSPDGSVAGGERQFTGVLTGMTETGVIHVTIAASGRTSSPLTSSVTERTQPLSLSVSGTLKFGTGGTIPVTGTYDDVTGAFTIMGGGYMLSGTLTPSGINGTYTGPNGGGAFTMLAGTSGVNVYCGTYATTVGSPGNGRWNLVEGSGGSLSGSANPGTGLTGTRSGNTIMLTFTGGTATGTVSSGSITGTWTGTNSSGTWMGSITGCM